MKKIKQKKDINYVIIKIINFLVGITKTFGGYPIFIWENFNIIISYDFSHNYFIKYLKK